MIMVVYASNQLVLMLLWAYYYAFKLPMRWSWKKDLAALYVGFLIHCFLSLAIFGYPGNPNDLPYTRMIYSYVTEIIMLLIVKKAGIKEILIASGWQLVFSSLSELIAMSMIVLFNNFDLQRIGPEINVSVETSILNDLVFILEVEIFFRYGKKHHLGKRNNLFMIILLLLCYQFMMAYLMIYQILASRPHLVVFISILILIILLDLGMIRVVFQTYQSMKKEKMLFMETKIDQQIQEQFSLLFDKQQVMEEIYQEIVRKQELQADDLVAYKMELQEIRNKLYCDDPAINALLNHYHKLCEKGKIAFTINIKGELKAQINEYDLNSLLANILQNAYEECHGNDQMWIKLEIVKQDKLLFIRCHNTLNPLKQAIRYKKISGQGKKIIQAIVAKYQGYAEFKIEDDIAIASIDMTI